MDRSRRLDDVDVLDSNLVKFRGLYSFHDTEESQFKSKKQNIHDFGSSALYKDVDNESITSQSSPRLSERPVTPINDSIKSAPKTYATLSKLIHRRIHPRPEWDHISVEDQSSLGAVIMGEVNTVWPLLRNQLDDPFLNRHQNRELQRRITVHCVTVCEHLFLHYSEKVKTLNNKGIFTNSANMCRVRGQLAVDAGKYLNILSVRRHIVADLKKPPTKEQITYSREEASRSPSTPGPPQRPKQLSFRKLIKSSRPQRKLKYQFNLRAEIQEMQSVMPSISLSKIEALMNKSYTFLPSRPKDLEIEDDDNTDSESLDMKTDVGKSSPDFERSLIHRCPSEPSLPHTLLLDEILQIEKEEEDYLLMRSPSMVQESSLDLPPNTPMPVKEVEKIRCHTSQGLRTGPKSDTKVLESSPTIVDKVEKDSAKENLSTLDYMTELQTDAGDEELPPLIQAITRRQRQDAKLRELKKKEMELDKKREAELEERMKPLPQAQYPQPPIVQSKLPGVSNPMTRKPITIRASDVKINDHVDLSSVSLKLYHPVYNDLKGDISPATVKELDANLFQGGELKEVYFEIMKTVPNIHQRYDNDPLIVSPASNVDLSKILASSTLARPRSQQVINPNLTKDYLDMPWNGQQLNIPKPTYQPYAGYPSSEATSVSHVQEEISAFHRFTPSQLQHPGVDKGSRAYASWLQWWKSTVNSDDFFKYLSTQDTDFLSVIFHFYDSEYDDSELESVGTDKLEAQRERERKLAELKKEKEEFHRGWWNVKSVILGGLGKDPVIEEDEHEISEMVTPLSTSRSQRMSQSPAMTLSRTPRNSTPRSRSSPRGTTFSSKPKSNTTDYTHRKQQESPRELTVQERLEIIWEKLKMPDSQKLDSALKYSTDEYIKLLPEITLSWEQVTDAILKREKIMANLEIFEKEASDPNRFFEKEEKGSSVARLTEAKTRASLYKKLEMVDASVRELLASIKKRFSDVVTFNGRPYHEKMDWDRVEMLYFLQQERRCLMLQAHGHPESLDAFVGHGQVRPRAILPPITKTFTLIPINSVRLTVPE